MTDAGEVLTRILATFPEDRVSPLVLEDGERLVAAARIREPAWLAAQLDLRGERWGTGDRRVLATLWWYSASVWTIAPTVASLVLGTSVLSAALDDLELHWLPDSRITGATSARTSDGADPVEAAGATLRALYEEVIPRVAEAGSMRERPLWAIAADALAGRLIWAGDAAGDLDRATDVLGPLSDLVGVPLPRAAYLTDGRTPGRRVDRCSCCLLYLAPRQVTCGDCPRNRSLVGAPSRRSAI